VTREQIIDKIKKLLRMKRGGTPDEVATALRLAQELAEKHGIELDQINPNEESQERPISHDDVVHGARIQVECRYAALVANQFFNVRVFSAVTEDRRKYCMRFVGTSWDTQIAIYVYHFLLGQFRRAWRTDRGRCRNRQAFLWGMYCAICNKLKQRQPKTVDAPGLVPVGRTLQRCNQYIQERWKLREDNVKPDHNADEAAYRGWIAGQRTEIRSGVDGRAGRDGLTANGGVKLLTG
jgi:hypothetical protein